MDEQNTLNQSDEQVDETFDEIVEQEVVSSIDELLSSEEETNNPAETRNPITLEKEQETDTKEEAGTNNIVINDELINKFPSLKPLKGKMLDDVFNSYQNLNTWGTKISQELSEYKKKTAENKIEKPDISEQDIIDLSPKDQAEYFKRLAKQEIENELNSFRQELNPLREISIKKQQEILTNEIQSKLPEGYKFEEILEEWKQANRDVLYDENGNIKQSANSYFASNPDAFVKSITDYAEIKKYREGEKDVKKQIYKSTINNLKKTSDAKSIKSNMSREPENLDDTQKLMQEIMDSIVEY